MNDDDLKQGLVHVFSLLREFSTETEKKLLCESSDLKELVKISKMIVGLSLSTIEYVDDFLDRA